MRNHRKIGVSWLKKREAAAPYRLFNCFEIYSARVILMPYSG